jgi:23S rRNA (adenine-C8)-methyltransferase
VRHLYHVNLLPYNYTEKGAEAKEDLGAPDGWREKSTNVVEFMHILQKNDISCSYRNAFGVDIDAACGQMAAKYSGGGSCG